jgi:hypothetical protein
MIQYRKNKGRRFIYWERAPLLANVMVEVMWRRYRRERKAEGGRDICSQGTIGFIMNDTILKTDGKIYLLGVSPSTWQCNGGGDGKRKGPD